MLEWLQVMKLAAGQSDHQCCFFLKKKKRKKRSLINRSWKIVCDLCQGFAGNTEASSSNCASPAACVNMQSSSSFFFFFFFSCKVSTWKREIVWKPFASQGLHGEKPHRAELCKNVWCRFLSWAYATFCFREAVFVWWPFSQSCNSGHGEEGLVRDSSCLALCEHYDMHDLAKNTRSAKAYQQCCSPHRLYLLLVYVHYRSLSHKASMSFMLLH